MSADQVLHSTVQQSPQSHQNQRPRQESAPYTKSKRRGLYPSTTNSHEAQKLSRIYRRQRQSYPTHTRLCEAEEAHAAEVGCEAQVQREAVVEGAVNDRSDDVFTCC